MLREEIKQCFLDAYDNGMSFQKLYIGLFGNYPSQYGLGFTRETNLFIEDIDPETLKRLYPESEEVIVAMIKVKMPAEPTSCVEDEEEEDDIYIYEYWLLGQHYRPSMVLINMERKFIARIGEDGIILYHELGMDCDAEIDFIVKGLPKRPVKDIEERKGKIQLVCNDGDGYYTIESRINKMDIDIDKQYNDDFKPVYNGIVDFLDKDNRKSGIVILNGEPGTGKTTFIRHLVFNVPGNYIFINNAMGVRISSPEFISFLLAHKDSIFILEDCEGVVMDRQITGFTNAVAAILNMADGIMSDIFNGKFICTFNADIGKVDPALMRKGRCFGKYEFKKLDGKKAQALLKERGFDVENCKDMTLADIYNYEVGNIEESPTQKRIGFGVK